MAQSGKACSPGSVDNYDKPGIRALLRGSEWAGETSTGGPIAQCNSADPTTSAPPQAVFLIHQKLILQHTQRNALEQVVMLFSDATSRNVFGNCGSEIDAGRQHSLSL